MNNWTKRFQTQFEGLKVSLPEVSKHIEHLYADYVELVALFSNKIYVTREDILKRLDSENESTLSDLILNEADEDEDLDDLIETNNAAKRNDIKERWINKIYRVIYDRTLVYKHVYPFEFDSHRGLILKENISESMELYIFLLISSNLSLFDHVAIELTRDFEEVSSYALKSYLPNAIVKEFGINTSYAGLARNKIEALSKNMKLEINKVSFKNIGPKNQKERGLDLIAWFPFEDNCPNMIVILAQCACGKDWASKYHDTKRFQNYMRYFRQKPLHAMFIPYGLISKNKARDWFHRSDDIEANTLMFERKRIIDLFLKQNKFENFKSKIIVKKCVNYYEDLV